MDIKPFLDKAARFCARYETCIFDLRNKLHKWHVPEELHDQIIEYLVENKFIDERRYAQSFVHDKFYLNHWGKRRIYYALIQKQIPEKAINLALEQIDTQDYISTLKNLLTKKAQTIKTDDSLILKQKLINYAVGRGYEPEVIYAIVNELLNRDL